MHQRFGNVEGAQGMFARLLRQQEEQPQKQPPEQPVKGKERSRRGSLQARKRGWQQQSSAVAVTCDVAMYRRMLNVYYQVGQMRACDGW